MSQETTTRRMIFARTLEWERIGNVIKIQATLIDEGVWIGSDNKPTYFSVDVIHQYAHTFKGKHIKDSHKEGEEYVIGFITAVAKSLTGAKFEGIIFDQRVIDEFELGLMAQENEQSYGWSIEAEVVTHKDSENDIVESFEGYAVARVGNPACKTCRTDSIKPIKLGKEKMANDKPSSTEFFDWIEDKLKEAGVDEEEISKVMSVLKKAVKSPYPYPAAKAGGDYPKPDEDKMESKKVTEALSKELEEKRAKIEELSEKLRAATEQFNAKNTELGTAATAANTKIKELEAEIAKYKAAEEKVKLEAINGLVEEIKKLDKEFDSVKFLEGIECLDSKHALLSRYLDSVRRVSKVKMETPLQAGDTDSREAVAKKFLEEIGVSNVQSIIEGYSNE